MVHTGPLLHIAHLMRLRRCLWGGRSALPGPLRRQSCSCWEEGTIWRWSHSGGQGQRSGRSARQGLAAGWLSSIVCCFADFEAVAHCLPRRFTLPPLLPVCAAAAGPAARSPPPSTLCMALPTCWPESSSCSSCPRLAIKAAQPPCRPTSLPACLPACYAAFPLSLCLFCYLRCHRYYCACHWWSAAADCCLHLTLLSCHPPQVRNVNQEL